MGKRLTVSSLGFSIGGPHDDFAIPGGARQEATIGRDMLGLTASSPWTLVAIGPEVELNDEIVHGAHALESGDRIQVHGAHFVFLSDDDGEDRFHEVIYHLTIKDFATGMHNARYLTEVLERETQRSSHPNSDLSVGVIEFVPVAEAGTVRASERDIRRFAKRTYVRLDRDRVLARSGEREAALVAPATASDLLRDQLRDLCDDFSRHEGAAVTRVRWGVSQWVAPMSTSQLLDLARTECRSMSA